MSEETEKELVACDICWAKIDPEDVRNAEAHGWDALCEDCHDQFVEHDGDEEE